MANRGHSMQHVADNVWRITWVGLLNGDIGTPATLPTGSDKCVMVSGTQGVGGSISIKGSNKDDVASATDPILSAGEGGANPLTFGALSPDKIEQIQENPLHVYPHVTAGDGTTNYEVRIIVKR